MMDDSKEQTEEVMATHITCHSNECLPNQFPPPRPTARHHGMLSDYTKSHVMSQSIPTISTSVEGGTTFPNDDDMEPLPMYRRITPVNYDRQDLTSLVDPELCVTPEKSMPSKSRINRSPPHAKTKTPPSPSTPTQSKSQKVRFDQLVTVKHLSPDEPERSEIIEIDRSDDTAQELSFDFNDEQPFDESYQSDNYDDNAETFPKSYSYNLTHQPGEDSQIQSIVTGTNELNIGSQTGTNSSLRSEADHHPVMRRKVARSSPEKQQRTNDILLDSDIIDVRPSKMAPTKTMLMEGSGTEHVLARPEFNSTLFMSKEVQEMANKEIDISSAVAERLKSDKIKTKLDEKTYSVLNRGRSQFPELISVDVKEDDLIETAALEIGAKVKPTHKLKQPKPEDSLPRPPDIMDFFTPDLQREVPCFSLPHITAPPTGLTGADPLSAFDTYNHIRAWEDW